MATSAIPATGPVPATWPGVDATVGTGAPDGRVIRGAGWVRSPPLYAVAGGGVIPEAGSGARRSCTDHGVDSLISELFFVSILATSLRLAG